MDADPTLQLANELRNPAKYRKYGRVPIFTPHKRKRSTPILGPDGQPERNPDGTIRKEVEEIEVTKKDLETIAKNINERWQKKGIPIVFGPGHTRHYEREENQPGVWAYGIDATVGNFGPSGEPAIVVDTYISTDHLSDLKGDYPFRSAEYYHDTKEITRVAFLRRDPQLDLGVMTYERGPAMCYAMEGSMDMPSGTNTGMPGGGDWMEPHDDEPLTYGRLKAHPAWKYMCGMYERDNGGGMDMPPPDSGGPPPMADTPQTPAPETPPPEQFNRDMAAIQYQRQEERIAQLERRLEAEQYARRQSECQLIVADLVRDGYQIPNPAKEVERLAKLEGDARRERVTEIRECYQRGAPTAEVGFLRIADDTPHAPRRGEHEMTKEEVNKALAYQRQHQCEYEEACAVVTGRKQAS